MTTQTKQNNNSNSKTIVHNNDGNTNKNNNNNNINNQSHSTNDESQKKSSLSLLSAPSKMSAKSNAIQATRNRRKSNNSNNKKSKIHRLHSLSSWCRLVWLCAVLIGLISVTTVPPVVSGVPVVIASNSNAGDSSNNNNNNNEQQQQQSIVWARTHLWPQSEPQQSQPTISVAQPAILAIETNEADVTDKNDDDDNDDDQPITSGDSYQIGVESSQPEVDTTLDQILFAKDDDNNTDDDNNKSDDPNSSVDPTLRFVVPLERRRLNRDRALEPPNHLRTQPMRRNLNAQSQVSNVNVVDNRRQQQIDERLLSLASALGAYLSDEDRRSVRSESLFERMPMNDDDDKDDDIGVDDNNDNNDDNDDSTIDNENQIKFASEQQLANAIGGGKPQITDENKFRNKNFDQDQWRRALYLVRWLGPLGGAQLHRGLDDDDDDESTTNPNWPPNVASKSLPDWQRFKRRASQLLASNPNLWSTTTSARHRLVPSMSMSNLMTRIPIVSVPSMSPSLEYSPFDTPVSVRSMPLSSITQVASTSRRPLVLVLHFKQWLEPQVMLRVLQVLDAELGLPALKQQSAVIKNDLIALRLDSDISSPLPSADFIRDLLYRTTGAVLESLDVVESEATIVEQSAAVQSEKLKSIQDAFMLQLDQDVDSGAFNEATAPLVSLALARQPSLAVGSALGRQSMQINALAPNSPNSGSHLTIDKSKAHQTMSAHWLALISGAIGALVTFVLVALVFRHRAAVKRKVGSTYQDLCKSNSTDDDTDCEAGAHSKCSKLSSKLTSVKGKLVDGFGSVWTRTAQRADFCSPSGQSGTISGVLSGQASQSTPNQAASVVGARSPIKTEAIQSKGSSQEGELTSQMDISAAHMILAYMEEHLSDKRRLERDWRAISTYTADPSATNEATTMANEAKNRRTTFDKSMKSEAMKQSEEQLALPYDHSRVKLNAQLNNNRSDYINASTIYDHEPRKPTHIITQAPLRETVADFWQMVWEQGSSVIVMLTRLNEDNVNMCHCYWPNDPKVPNETHGHFEIHLVSEHIICSEYLVRSIYLMNLKTFETRTVTQFHYLAWPNQSVPANVANFLEFRRKVNKSYRNGAAPIIVHCNNGTGRSGTYTLIDMVLNRISEGAREIDIAATLEHLRDQRMGVVANMKQFEFVLVSVAAEVQAILDALPQ